MARRMAFADLSMTSDCWLALGDLCFPGERPWREGAKGWRFYCEVCDQPFASLLTPTRCPHCQAEPAEQAVTITHKTVTGKTFPFFVPVR